MTQLTSLITAAHAIKGQPFDEAMASIWECGLSEFDIETVRGVVSKIAREPRTALHLSSVYALCNALENAPRSAADWIDYISIVTSVSVGEITGRSRKGPHADARALAMHEIRKNTNLSLVQIGRSFNRDHSTVSVAIQKISERGADIFPDYFSTRTTQ